MLTTGNLIEAAGITAAIAVVLLAGLCVVANAAFKAQGMPADDDGDE